MSVSQGSASLATRARTRCRAPSYPQRPAQRRPLSRPTLTPGPRGFVKINLSALRAALGTLTATQSPARALADLGELLVVLIDVADHTGRVRGGAYRHLLVAPGSWDERRHRLAAAGLLELDHTGRLHRIPASWHQRLTAGDAPDGETRRTVPFAVAQRDEFRRLTAQLRGCRSSAGRPLPGIARLLPLLIVLSAPTVSDGEGYIVPSQAEIAQLLGITDKTLRRHLADLAGLGLIAPATRRRRTRTVADSDTLWWVGATRDRLAGRMWQPAGLPTGSPPPTRPASQRSGHLTPPRPPTSAVISPPPLKGSASKGFHTSSGRAAHPQQEPTTPQSRGGPSVRWEPGTATRPDYRQWTIEAVRKLPLNAQSVRELVAVAAHKSLGAGLRAGVLTALDAALDALDRHAAGESLSDEARDLVDTVARLARQCDDICAVGVAGRAAVTLTCEDPAADGPRADRWWHDGTMIPAAAVRLLSSRLQPYVRAARAHPSWADTRGNWRHRAAAETPRRPPPTHTDRDPGHTAATPHPQMPSAQAVRLVRQVALAAMDDRRADRAQAQRIAQAWATAALTWWDGPAPPTAELTDPDMRHIAAAWATAQPAQARQTLT